MQALLGLPLLQDGVERVGAQVVVRDSVAKQLRILARGEALKGVFDGPVMECDLAVGGGGVGGTCGGDAVGEVAEGGGEGGAGGDAVVLQVGHDVGAGDVAHVLANELGAQEGKRGHVVAVVGGEVGAQAFDESLWVCGGEAHVVGSVKGGGLLAGLGRLCC